jgi:tRNA-splicing ligase RtcB
MQRWFVNLPDTTWRTCPRAAEHFDDYVARSSWAQGFAATNRALMMDAVLARAARNRSGPFTRGEAVNCHHNYVARERHFGADVLVTRKGAVRAGARRPRHHPRLDGRQELHRPRQGQPESFCSCSHGAGRR